jgi:hypothetical protein
LLVSARRYSSTSTLNPLPERWPVSRDLQLAAVRCVTAVQGRSMLRLDRPASRARSIGRPGPCRLGLTRRSAVRVLARSGSQLPARTPRGLAIRSRSATRQRYTRPCSVPPGAADVSPAPGPAPVLSDSLRLFLRVRHDCEALRSIVPLFAYHPSQYPRGSQAVSSPARHVSRTPSESVPILAHGPSVPLAPIVSAPASVPLGARAISSPAR